MGEKANSKCQENGTADLKTVPDTESSSKSNPILEASWISSLLYWWVFPLVWQGYRRRLEPEDVYGVLPKCTSEAQYRKLERSWKTEKKESLIIRIVKIKGKDILKYLCGNALQEITRTLQPVLVVIVVAYLQDKNQVNPYIAYASAVGSVICGLVGGVVDSWHSMGWYTMAMQLRSMLSEAIYRKVLRLSNAAFSQIKSGHIVTLIANDVEKFHQTLMGTGQLLVAVIEVPIILGLMAVDFGISAVGGIVILVTTTIVFIFMAKVAKTIRFQVAKCTDSRVLVMGEILAAMRVIKMYCWEKPFSQVIMKHRKAEIRNIFKMIILRVFNSSLSNAVSKLGVGCMIFYQVWSGGALELGSLLRLISWWEMLKRIAGYYIAFTLASMNEMFACIKRIEDFLLSEEKSSSAAHDVPEHITELNKYNTQISSDIYLNEFSANWSDTFSLDNINISVPKGALVAVVGPVGAGKTSLLMALLRELPVSSGSVSVCGSIGYVPQEAWIFSDTLRANVLFGQNLNYDAYSDTIQACCLQPDISSMPHGDLTLVGERGLMLSGGQKARINLARAVYREADTYLLDDPLSAVDSKVGRQIYDRCILAKLKGKTRVLVTHQLQYLDKVDHIYVIKEGKLIADGSYNDLIQQVNLQSVISWNKNAGQSVDASLEEEDEGNDGEVVPSQTGNAIEEERREKGTVAMTTFTRMLWAGHGVILFPLVLLLYAIYRATFLGSDAWANYWVADYDTLLQGGNITLPLDVNAEDTHAWLVERTWVYVVLVAAGVITVMLAMTVFALVMAMASRNMHDKMFGMVLRAPVAFFDTNPVGRILNRFSRDTAFVDDQLSTLLIFVTDYCVLFLGICVMVCVANPWSLIPTVPLFVIILLFRGFSIGSMREIKRIEGTKRSPVFSHLSASLQGLHVIRAFRMEHQMIETIEHLQDVHTAAWYLFMAVFRWFGLYCDMILLIYYAIVLVVMFLLPMEGSDAGLVGISLTYVIGTMGTFQFIIRMTAELESLMTSAERIQQYSRLEQEAPEHADILPPNGWPQKGEIQFDDMSMAYSDDKPDVLKNITVTIEGQQKVGIVGRTGAGKTSLFSALLRLREPRGQIWIDGIDITKLGLTDLRQVISVIPQDPVLFSGTFRYNLDPFSEYGDERIWAALDEVQLKTKIEGLPGGLEASVSESGGNLSVGERQLVCLARAILRQSRILIIDEATANVDHRTDELIQRAIREKFEESTLLCIAHRLNTIIDSHKVMVVDDGQVVQFDHPHILLQDTSGLFHQMALHSGPDQLTHLKNVAEAAFHRHMGNTRKSVSQTDMKHDTGLSKSGYYNEGMDENDILENTRL